MHNVSKFKAMQISGAQSVYRFNAAVIKPKMSNSTQVKLRPTDCTMPARYAVQLARCRASLILGTPSTE